MGDNIGGGDTAGSSVSELLVVVLIAIAGGFFLFVGGVLLLVLFSTFSLFCWAWLPLLLPLLSPLLFLTVEDFGKANRRDELIVVVFLTVIY